MEQWQRFIERGRVFFEHFLSKRDNIIATLVILTGLFAGSLFVDIGQLITGAGFSGRAIRSHDVLTTEGRTWVAYTDPKVNLSVVSDETCLECDPSEALMWLRRIVPTIEAKRVDIGSAEGRSLAERLRLPTLPAFVFAEGVTATDFYSQAAPLFRIEGDEYVFDMNKIGMPVGRYLIAPGNAADDIVIGAVEAPVTLVVFSDFQCQFCKDFHETTKRVSAEYGERLRVVFKHLPLPTHPQAGKAAEAAQCAAAQGKFLPYADLLFARQGEWGRGTSTARFRDYAFRVPGMDTKAFSTCLESGTFAGKVSADIQLAEEFNLYSAPSAFVNEEFVSGAAPYEDLKALIDAALAR